MKRTAIYARVSTGESSNSSTERGRARAGPIKEPRAGAHEYRRAVRDALLYDLQC